MAIALRTQDYDFMGGVVTGSSYLQNQRVIRKIMKPRDPRPCPHLWFSNASCLNCGKIMSNHQIHAMPYVKVYDNNVTLDRYTNRSLYYVKTNIKLQNPRNMYLVLDLDHTLLNSIPISDLSLKEDNYLKDISPDDAFKRGLYRLYSMGIITKLRPSVRKFLEEASRMFEMYIYTMGDRPYALEMAKLLDPENKYFNSRIISRDDCVLKHEKRLDILQTPENCVLILDDTRSMWPNNKDNLIDMDRYMYFSSSCRKFGYNGKSLAELRRDEDESNGALSSVLQVLMRIHKDFSDDESKILDVRDLLKDSRKEILRGCKIVFSGVIPRNYETGNQSNHPLWKMAEELGAKCVSEVESSVTHVVSNNSDTEKSRWGVREGKLVANPRWIEAAYYLWRRQPEDEFPVNLFTSKQIARFKLKEWMVVNKVSNSGSSLNWEEHYLGGACSHVL